MSRGDQRKLRLGAAAIFLVLLLGLAGPSRADKVLKVKEVFQEHNQWCWAAVSVAVLGFYGKTVTQCSIAEYTRSVAQWHNFGSVDCCVNPNAGCNYWNYLMPVSKGSLPDIIKQFGGVDAVGTTGLLSTRDVALQIIRDEHPFIIRWGKGSGGHFIVINGITGGDKVHYMDPWYGEGKKIATHAWVVKGGSHTWTHTLTTGSCLCSTKGACCDGCEALNQGGKCSDGDLCTSGDACQWGSCTGAKVQCPAKPSSCHHKATCNPATGTCSSLARRDGAACDDGNPCSTQDVCSAGVCLGKTWTRCPPLDSCHHWGVCDPSTAACSSPMKADGTPCTGGQCVQGTCVPPDAGPDSAPDTSAGPLSDGPPLPDLDSAIDSSVDPDAAPDPAGEEHSGCGCDLAATPAGANLVLLLALLFVVRRLSASGRK